MRSRTTTWDRITRRGNFELETKAKIGNVEYTEISAPGIERTLMSSPLSVGNCQAATLSLSILTSDKIAASSPVVIQGRVNDGKSFSEWKDFGTFFINQRDTSYEGLVTLSCYDAMLKANQSYVTGSNEANWPKTMSAVVKEIAYRIGVSVDTRTTIKSGADYMVPFPAGLSMLQVLGYIGACHGGNWIITEENKLRLVPLVTSPDETFFVIDYDYNHIKTDDGFTLIHDIQTVFNAVLPGQSPGLINVPVVLGQITTGTPVTVSGVIAEDEAGNSYTAGDDSGTKIDLGRNPYVTQAICDALYQAYGGLVYSPYTASKAVYDPAVELGDQVKIGDKVFSVVMAENLTLDLAFSSTISAPNSEELSAEYPYLSEISKLKQTAAELNASVEVAAKELKEAVETVSGDTESMRAVLTAEITRASGVEAELSTRIENEEKRAKEAEKANAGNIETLKTDISSLKTKTNGHDTRLEALESASGGASGEISGLGKRLATAEQDISEIKEKNTAQDTSLSTLDSLLSGHATRLLALENTNTQQAESISGLRTDVDGLKPRIEALETGITTLQETVQGYGTEIASIKETDQAQASAIETLQNTLTDLSGQIGALQTVITEINARLTALEGSGSEG